MSYGLHDMNPGPSLNPPEQLVPDLCERCEKRPVFTDFREDVSTPREFLCEPCWLGAVIPYPCFDCFAEVAL
jgi:hypothetical protein